MFNVGDRVRVLDIAPYFKRYIGTVVECYPPYYKEEEVAVQFDDYILKGGSYEVIEGDYEDFHQFEIKYLDLVKPKKPDWEV